MTRSSFLALSALLLLPSCARKTHDHAHGSVSEPKPEATLPFEYPHSVQAGSEIGMVFESWLSPQQEAGEEENVPKAAPDVFKSTKPSTPREQRPSRGHGVVAFTKDFSRAYVSLEVNVAPEEIVMAHLHCGKPGQLGPIIVDFGSTGDVSEYFKDGRLEYEIVNRDLERVLEQSKGVVGAFTAGCPIIKSVPSDRVRTIGGMATIATEGDLYFNIHTASQTFYGDIRGQLHPASQAPAPKGTPAPSPSP
ncbi:MAG: CHRD domain-containing protein [Myxococcota bacterium]